MGPVGCGSQEGRRCHRRVQGLAAWSLQCCGQRRRRLPRCFWKAAALSGPSSRGCCCYEAIFNSEKIWCLWLMISDASACINCHDVRKRGEGLRACPTWGPRLPWPGGPVAPAASPCDPVLQPCLALTLPVLRLDAPAHVLPALGTH